MVYVDSGPATGRARPRAHGAEMPHALAGGAAATRTSTGSPRSSSRRSGGGPCRSRAAPCATAPELTNDARLDVPSTVICTGFTSEQVKAAVEEGYAWLGGLTELRNVTYVDLPTSHWPMWSRPQELAAIIGDVAKAHPADPTS